MMFPVIAWALVFAFLVVLGVVVAATCTPHGKDK
jgi:hypothetical protein